MIRSFIILLFVTLICSDFVSAQLTMKKHDEGIQIVDGNSNVLLFHIKPSSIDGEYERCNYIHPLYGIDGEILTEDFPADHPHHRGVFWAWPQIWIGNERIGDPWLLKDFKQEVTEIEFMKDPDKTVWIKSEALWSSDNWKKEGRVKPYIQENVSIHVHESKMKYRKIDFEISLLALEENLRIGGVDNEKEYGGFSVRLKLPEDVKFSGKNGSVEPTDNPLESPGFINISGAMGKGDSNGGVVILDGKDNPGYPQKWILREKSSMQNAVYPGTDPVPLSTTEPLVLKYSLIVYSGKMNSKKISKLFE